MTHMSFDHNFCTRTNVIKYSNNFHPKQKTDVTVELVEELQAKTKEYLQPNPTARAKMIAVKGISKLSGQAKSNTYPQAEGVLADCMLIYGKRLNEDQSLFGRFSAFILQINCWPNILRTHLSLIFVR